MSVKHTRISPPGVLEQRKAAVLRRWTGLVFDTYPSDTARILKSEGDRFANPVGFCVQHNLEMVLDGLAVGAGLETLFPYLEEIIKVRAVQDFTPEAAVSFMALLKRALAAETGRDDESSEYMQEINGKIDLLSKTCSGIYADCKMKIDRIKANEKRKAALNMSRMTGDRERE